jgi:response regulator RpfG family c-di-GMP phosphodiesterase
MNHSTCSFCSPAVADVPVVVKQPAILLIDDDPDVSQSLARYLSRYDVEVLQAYHGAHGIWLATTRRPGLIITDLRMPQGRGQDVVEYLKGRTDTCYIPIIVLTGLHSDELERQMRKQGVEEFFTKPVKLEDLRAVINCFVELREAATAYDDDAGKEGLSS